MLLVDHDSNISGYLAVYLCGGIYRLCACMLHIASTKDLSEHERYQMS